MSQHNDPTSPPESQLLHWSAAVGHGLPASDPQRKPWTRFLRDNWTRYQHATLDAVNTGNDIRMALRARMGVAMYGDRGTGKTYALVAAFVHLAEMGADALLVSEADLYDQLRRDMEREPWEERMVDRYLSVEALLIDDLGKANVTAWTAAQFFNVIHLIGNQVCAPMELPANSRHLDTYLANLVWSDMAFHCSSIGAGGDATLGAGAAGAAGAKASSPCARKRPVTVPRTATRASTNSPSCGTAFAIAVKLTGTRLPSTSSTSESRSSATVERRTMLDGKFANV